MAEFPDIPAGQGIPLVDMETYRFPDPTMEAIAAAPELKATYGAEINVRTFGATGDGVTDDTQALLDAMAANVDLYFPPGVYLTTATLVQKNYNVRLADGAVIKASAEMDVLWQVGTASLVVQRRTLQGGRLDANGLAVTGLWGYNFFYLRIHNVQVYSPAGNGIVLGEFGMAQHPYEPMLTNILVYRPSSATVPPDSYGIYAKNATDGNYENIIVVGFDVGVRADSGGGNWTKVHPWGHAGKLPKISFYDTSVAGVGTPNVYVECVADTPTQDGWRVSQEGVRLVACSVFMNENGPDNQVNGITTVGAAASVVAIGISFVGRPSVRLATDLNPINGASRAASTLLSTARRYNIASPKGDSPARTLDAVTTLEPTTVLTDVKFDNSNQVRYLRVRGRGVITKIGFEVAVQSGNVSVAAYQGTGVGRSHTPGARLATSGTVACPGVGWAEVALPSPVTVEDGDFLAFSCDNITASFRGISGSIAAPYASGFSYMQASQHPAPVTPGTLSATMRALPMLVGIE